MASSSSSSLTPRNYSYNVFSSFHGPDVRETFLSHLREQFNHNGISMFDDQKIVRSATIAPSLTEAIKESRISIVILSKKYASSSWCLDELVEILECKKTMGQIVMTIFYGVDQSHVRKQIGEFGMAFDETCKCKTDEERQKWSKALNEVGNIAGEDFLRCDNEANMIKKIARDVSDKLNDTPSRDFDGMVGLEDHLSEMESLLDLDNFGVKMVAITGPAGIGKTTIARALQSRLSGRFQLTCFVDNLRGSYQSGLDELRLQEQFLSKVLNQDGLRISHSGVIEERLCKQRVLIILDDVNHIKQLMALANETTWFGPGSRIVVTTENKELLQQHGINNTYHVRFPSSEEALKILCSYAFRQTSPCHGFKELAESVAELCGRLPLGLSVVGSSLRRKKEDEWEDVVRRLETNIDRDIEDVLKVGYERLGEYEQTLFLHIAVFFLDRDEDLVRTMFADRELDVNYGLKILKNRSLIDGDRRIVMHRLLQEVGKKVIRKQAPGKRQILIDASDICYVLENAKGTPAVSGISFDISDIEEVSISKKAFRKMPNLRFMRVYKSRYDGNYKMHIPKEMEFPCRLRLLDWKAYPSKSLPPLFNPEYLVELFMPGSQLGKLWEGTKPLQNLKRMDLSRSKNLKELPDLSNATNLKRLSLSKCESLVEIPSSFSHLHKLKRLDMFDCINLQVIPADMNLASLERVYFRRCSRLRNIPHMSTNIFLLDISDTAVTDLPPSIRLCSRLDYVSLSSCGNLNLNLRGLTHLPKSVTSLDLTCSDIERIPDCIKALHQLYKLDLGDYRRLISLPELPGSLRFLYAENCVSLETVFSPLRTTDAEYMFTNCFKLGQQAPREIFQQPFCYRQMLLPGSQVPEEFDHRAIGSCLTIALDGNRSYSGFAFCLVLSPSFLHGLIYSPITWGPIIAEEVGYPAEDFVEVCNYEKCETDHLFIFRYRFKRLYRSEVNRVMMFDFSNGYHKYRGKYRRVDIMACGAKILTQEESIEGRYESGSDQVFEDDIDYNDPTSILDDIEFEPSEEALEDDKHTVCWSWLFSCFGLSDLVSGSRR